MNTRKLLLWVNIGLIIAIAISAVFLGIMVSQGPSQATVPRGVPYNVIYIGPTEIKIEFGNFSQHISFSDLIIEVTAPNGDVGKADVKNATTEYAQNTAFQSLSSIRISSSGAMDKGTSFTLLNYRDLQTGPWAFKMTYRNTGQLVSGGTIIVPDVDATPQGSFSGLNKISSNEVRLEFGTIAPSTEFSYCYIVAWGPSTATTVLYLNNTTSMRVQMDDGTLLSVVDSNGDGMINLGDYVSLQTVGRELTKGQWSIEADYYFTNEKIANAAIDL